MELIKRVFIVCLFLGLSSLIFNCKNKSNKPKNNQDEIEKVFLQKNTYFHKSEDSVLNIKYKRVKEVIKKGDEYVFNFFSITLTEREGEDVFFKQNLNVIKDNKKTSFKIEDDFDLGEFNLWVYQSSSDYIYLLELDDYYNSIFYVYHFSNGCLTRLGDFLMTQPNIESDGIKKESFNIEKKNHFILIETFLDQKKTSSLKMILDPKKCISSI